MKLILSLIFTFLLTQSTEARQCFKSEKVNSTDSLYTLYSNFVHKNQYTYKRFLTVVKNENGMTKGSDILKLRGKRVTIPYTCIEKKAKDRKVTSRARTNHKRRRYDPLGLTQQTKTSIKKQKKNIVSNKYSVIFKSSNLNYKSKTKNTDELSPLTLKLHKFFPLEGVKTKLDTSLQVRHKKYNKNLQKTLTANDIDAAVRLKNSINMFDISTGLILSNQHILNSNYDSTDDLTTLNIGIEVDTNITLFNNHYTVGIDAINSLIHMNPTSKSSARLSEQTFFATWHITRDYSLKTSYETFILSQSKTSITKNGLSFSLRLSI